MEKHLLSLSLLVSCASLNADVVHPQAPEQTEEQATCRAKAHHADATESKIEGTHCEVEAQHEDSDDTTKRSPESMDVEQERATALLASLQEVLEKEERSETVSPEDEATNRDVDMSKVKELVNRPR